MIDCYRCGVSQQTNPFHYRFVSFRFASSSQPRARTSSTSPRGKSYAVGIDAVFTTSSAFSVLAPAPMMNDQSIQSVTQ